MRFSLYIWINKYLHDENFTDYKSPVILWSEDSSVKIYRAPLVTILPDINTNEISESSFNIVDSGYFIAPQSDASVNVVLEMRDSANRVVYSGDASLYFNLEGNKLKEPVLPYGPIVYPGDVYSKTIDIYIVNSVTAYNDSQVGPGQAEAFGVIRNVTIV